MCRLPPSPLSQPPCCVPPSQKKRLKQHRRNIRKNREEIEEDKADRKSTYAIASVLFSAHLADNDTYADLERLEGALHRYQAGAAKDHTQVRIPPASRLAARLVWTAD